VHIFYTSKYKIKTYLCHSHRLQVLERGRAELEWHSFRHASYKTMSINNLFSTTAPHAAASFLAGDEQIQIVPSFTHRKTLSLMSRSVGPFTSGIEVTVPMWLALSFRKRGLCRIKAPEFMKIENLENILRYERENNTFCDALPHRHSEIARAILSISGLASDADAGDLAQPELVRALLEDIEAVRMDKIRNNIKIMSEQSLNKPDTLPAIDVTGIGSLEIQETRPFLVEAFKWHRNASGRSKKGIDLTNVKESGRSLGGRNIVRSISGGTRAETKVMGEENIQQEPTLTEEIDHVDEASAGEEIMEEDESNIQQETSRLRRFR